MRRRVLLASLIQASVALAGCSSTEEDADPTPGATDTETETPTVSPTPTETPTPTPSPEFDVSVGVPVGGVEDEPVPIDVTVTNDGAGAGEYEATLTHDGTDLASETASVEPDGSTTVTIEHAFDETGEYEVTVAGVDATLAIFEHELEFVHAAMKDVDTHVIERSVSEHGLVDIGEGATDWEKDSTVTVETDFVEETRYERSEDALVYGSTDLDETIETWIVDGVLYEKHTKHTEGVVEYDKRFTEEPAAWSALDIHGFDTEGFLGFEHTDDEYVFVFDPSTPEEATALAARTVGEGGLLPAETATDARLELRYDRGTGRATTVDSELTLEGADVFPELERTATEEYGAYGDPVDVTVPDDVAANT